MRHAQFTQEEFANQLNIAMNLMQFESDIIPAGEYPLTIQSKLPGYEQLPVDLAAMFLPLEAVYGDEVEVFQFYFSLWEDDISAEKYKELEDICNFCNMNTATGVFGVQEDIARLCYKQGVPIRLDCDLGTSLKVVMDTLIMMVDSLDKVYDRFMAVL